jgi:hypothetical protein
VSEPSCGQGWITRAIEEYAVSFAARHNVPVHCNQWGVKDEVWDDQYAHSAPQPCGKPLRHPCVVRRPYHKPCAVWPPHPSHADGVWLPVRAASASGRLEYARAMLHVFASHGISSTYWIWRSYKKDGRDVDEPVWGFELAHNDGPHEALDGHMLGALQEGFATIARANAGNVWPCGAAAAEVRASMEVTPSDDALAAKGLALSQPTPVRFASLPLPTTGVECDVEQVRDRAI